MRLAIHPNETAIPSPAGKSRSFIDVFWYFYRRRLCVDRSLKLLDAVAQSRGVTIGLFRRGSARRKTETDLFIGNPAQVLQQPPDVRKADVFPAAKAPLDSVSINALDETFSLAGEVLAMPFAARECIAVAAK
jgi:hypothetical protein